MVMDLVEFIITVITEWFKSIGPEKFINEPSFEIVPTDLRSIWYLTPRQHAIEFLQMIVIFVPLAFLSFSYARQHPMWRTYRANSKHRGSNVFLSGCCFFSVGCVFYYKWTSPYAWRTPFLFQPCHILTTILGLLGLMNHRVMNGLFQVYMGLSWGAVLAFMFPDMSDYVYLGDKVNFWVEHTLMLLVPMIWIKMGRYQLIPGFSWIVFSYAITTLYHFVIVEYVALWTELNVNTMMSPPDIDVVLFAGTYFRQLLAFGLFVMHVVYNLVLQKVFSPGASLSGPAAEPLAEKKEG